MTRGQIETHNGGYELGDLLGRGGMGQVHAARHSSGQRVVVKRLRNTLALDARIAARFDDEGRVSRRVSHPNVVRVFDHGVSADGTPFIVMEHARGTTLRKLVTEVGALPLARVRGLMRQLLDGLTAIHAAGIVHADIKSNNLIVDPTATGDHLTIIDFGLARTRTSGAVFDDGVVAGTPEYMAPEVCRGGPPTIAADIYAAGVVAYELLVGITPFGGDAPLEVIQRQLSEEVALPDDAREGLSPELERVLLRALAKQPAQRFPDARGFAIAFEQAISALAPEEPMLPAAVPITVSDLVPCGEPETPEVLARRRELYAALDDRAPDPIIVAYLGLADALLADSRTIAAVQELEGALLQLVPRDGAPPRSLWRLESLLAALYERLGNSVRARRAAMDAHTHAVRGGCAVGPERTRALLRRLMMARTSLPPTTGPGSASAKVQERARTTPLPVRGWLAPSERAGAPPRGGRAAIGSGPMAPAAPPATLGAVRRPR
jgi:serine/threonine-protein kinase